MVFRSESPRVLVGPGRSGAHAYGVAVQTMYRAICVPCGWFGEFTTDEAAAVKEFEGHHAEEKIEVCGLPSEAPIPAPEPVNAVAAPKKRRKKRVARKATAEPEAAKNSKPAPPAPAKPKRGSDWRSKFKHDETADTDADVDTDNDEEEEE